MKRMILKKPLAILLACIMILSLSSVPALAGDGESGGNPASGLNALAFNMDSGGKIPLPMTPSFSNSTYSYTVTAPDYVGGLYSYASPANSAESITPLIITDRGTMQGWWTAGEWNSLYGFTAGTAEMNYEIHPGYKTPNDVCYKVKVQRQVTLSDLAVDGASLYPTFDPGTQSYAVGVPADATNAGVTATAYGSGYSLTIGGDAATSGTKTDVTLNDSGNTTVPITVSLGGAVSTTYNLTLIKEAKGATPVIYQNPLSATYFDTATPAALTVAASAGGDLTYQWYSNKDNSNSTGTIISGATQSSFTPPVSGDGTAYYYCVVTNTTGGGTASSDAAAITVNSDPTPTVVLQDNADSSAAMSEYDYNTGATPVTLKVSATSKVDGGIWNYQWNDSDYDWGMPTSLTYTPPTTKDSSMEYTCTAKYFVNGQVYTMDSNSVTIKVTATSAQAPNVTIPPASQVYLLGGTVSISPLTVTADSPDGGKISYQWYSNKDNSNSHGTIIDGATQSGYTPQSYDKANTTYYYCEVTNTVTSSNGNEYTTTTDTAAAAIVFGTASDLGGTWQGAGTVNDPYQITSADDLVKLGAIVNQGVSFEGCCFKLTADITLPANWVPMGGLVPGHNGSYQGVYMRPFSGTIDGNNTTLTVPDQGLPLLGYVRHATVKNLNLYGAHIAGYGLVNNYDVDYGPTGNYGSCNVDTINIYNVTLKAGTQTLKAGFIGGYASGINTVNIFGCTAEKGVTIGYDKDQSDIATFAGDFNGNIENCVSYADVYGKDNVGGFVGVKGQSMGFCAVRDSAFHGTVTATGSYAGGIFGSGYNVTSAPNSPCVTIQNCYSDGTVKGADYVGGIFGGEPVVKQCWANGIGYIQNNYFSGTVGATGTNVGGIIGYMNSLDKFNIIANNYYLGTCGATKGIGSINSANIDINLTGHYNRSDDPTGKDADKLAKSVSSDDLKGADILSALNTSINSGGNWTAGENGYPILGTQKHLAYIFVDNYPKVCRGGDALDTSKMVITATYTDGTTQCLDAKDVTFTGFDSSKRGYTTVTATYSNHNFLFEVEVISDADYPGDISSAKAAITGANYTYAMSDANTTDAVKALVEKQIAGLDLGGVTAAVTMGSFTAAAAGTSANAAGTNGSFTASVALSKGTANDTAAITGVISATAFTGGNTGGDNTVTVTFRLIGSTRSNGDIDLSNKDYKGASYVTWIPTTTYTLPKDSSMYDLFMKATSAAGLGSIGADNNYVKTINAPSVCGGYALSEFTNGPYSGWMYTVNKLHPGVGLRDYKLTNGAMVVWHYIDDYRYEDEDWVADSTHPALGNASTWSKWLLAQDTAPTSGNTGAGTQTGADSGNSSGNTTAPTLTPSVTASNGAAAASVSSSDMNAAIASAKKNADKSIVIAPKVTGEAKKVSIELPKNSISSIASDTNADLTVKTAAGNVTIPNGALSSITSQASGDTLTVSLNAVDSSSLTAAQQSAAGTNQVYDVSIMSGDSHISSFNGNSVTVSLPYTLKNGENADGIVVWYLDSTGKLQPLACTYDASTGMASFTTTHMSYYIVSYDATAAWTNPFTDVSKGAWYFDSVKYAARNGLFSGTTATTFAPEDNMTRAMLVTVLYRLDGKPSASGGSAFTDVADGQWYADAVKWASTNGIVSGYGNGLFGTDDSVTREQLAAILFNYAKYKGLDVTKTADLSSYSDAASIDSWAIDAMKWTSGAGLISGTTATELSPAGTATRAQVATILMRFAENFKK